MNISRGGRPVPGFSIGVAGASYEAAIAANPQHLDMRHAAAGPDLTDEQLSAPMRTVTSSLSTCGATDDMKVTVKIAVKLGKAVGVSVATDPPNAAVASCVDRVARGLRWPSSPKLDSFTTSY
jgi:hypothetical protein